MIDHSGSAFALISNKDDILISGGEKTIKLWDTSFNCLSTLIWHDKTIY